MSRTRWAFILILVIAGVLAACQPQATPTPSPRPPTTAPTEAATVEAVVPTEEVVAEVTEAVTEEMVATEEATEAMTETAPTEEMAATEEATVEATPEVGDVLEVAAQAGEFNTLLAAVNAAGLSDTLKGEGPFTIFAPTDAAFQALLDSTGMTADGLLASADLAAILKYHVVDGKVTSDELENYRSTDNPDQIIVPTLNGENLTITFADDGTVVINGTAKVTLANVEASNGVIHVIDSVLTPPSMSATEEPTMEVVADMTEESTVEAVPLPATMEATPEAEVAAPTEAPAETVASGATVTIAPDGTVVVGLAAGLSGEGIAPLGIDIQRGAELALADRPTVTVGDKTFNVQLDVQDDQCSADGGQAVANRFASDASIVGVVGPMCSSACRAAAPIFDAADYTTISPSCTAPDLTTSGYTSFNRSVVSDAFQGAIAAQYIYDVLGVRSIATIHDGSPYGEGLVNVVTQSFEALGGSVVSSDAVQVGDTDFRGLLDDIAQNDPELIYFGGFAAEAARLIQQRADAGLEEVPFMGADGIQGTEVVDLAGEAVAGVYATAAIPASSAALDDFLARYVETYGEEPPAPYHATAYDAVNLILDAVEAVGTVDADGNLVVDRGAVAEYIRTFTDFNGLTGVLNADGTGETSVSDIGIFQVQDGAFEQLYTGSLVDGAVQLTRSPRRLRSPASRKMAATGKTPMAEMTPEATAAS
ncbi:MAG: ABC transporter substrate-binding protein [Anaerolineae bacterium]